MWGHHPRFLLLSCLFLDSLGQLLIFLGISLSLSSSWFSIPGPLFSEIYLYWLFICLLIYPLLGWLFGSFTVLRWRRLSFSVLLQRLLITSSVTCFLVAIACFLSNPVEEVFLPLWPVHLCSQALLFIWSLVVRIALRRGLFLPNAPHLLLLASIEEIPGILKAWDRVAPRHSLQPIEPQVLDNLLSDDVSPLFVALSPSRRRDPDILDLINRLEIQDPQVVQLISVASLFDLQQERLPPSLLDDSGLTYEDLPWAAPFSVQAQLKRLADLIIAAVLLLCTAPSFCLHA